MKKKYIFFAIGCALLIGVTILMWNVYASSSRIAFVNYQAITLGEISKANDNSFVKLYELPVEELENAGDYDMVFVNGMGLRITDEQRQALVSAAENGTPVISTAVTNPNNQVTSVDSIDNEFLTQYLTGGKANYRNMLNYVRKYVDGKKIFVNEPGDPVLTTSSLLYYPNEGDEMQFSSVTDYEKWLQKSGKWNEGVPGIILTGQMGVPDELIVKLEESGCRVYPVNVIQRFIAEGHADSIQINAMINMAHGRMGDQVVEYLKERNIPLFSPLNVNRGYDDWMADKTGMNGGFLSQSVVTPEIDGAIRPFALFAHYEGPDGLPHVEAIPDRLDTFVSTINNYIALQSKPNKDKRVAIFYFKGPGQNALVAEGMDVAPSLYNLLKKLKSEGYSVDNLPADAEAFEQLINQKGKIFNDYAIGAKDDFVTKHSPEIITRTDYDDWCNVSISNDMRRGIDEVDGEFPGHGLSDDKGNLALARIRFGNVVIIPQTAVGLSDDDFKMVHGTDAAPLHNYVAAYLWVRHRFEADALMHFGAHGSLEFTPRKQVALGSEDWADRLVGNMPHFYVYSTSNVGEAMMAKRRSYATILNYLTPPFMDSEVRGIYKNLSDAIMEYNKLNGADKVDDRAIAKVAGLVKKYTVELGIHRDLRLDSVMTSAYTDDEILRIENFAEELANEKISGALYVMGVPYSPEHIRSTVMAMTVDPLAYSLQKLHGGDIRTYRSKAVDIVDKLIRSGKILDDVDICRFVNISQHSLDSARNLLKAIDGSKDMFSRMMVMGAMMPAAKKEPLKVSERVSAPTGHKMLPGMSPEKALEMAKKMGADSMALKKMEAAIKRKSVVAGGKSSKGHPGMLNNELTPQEIEFANSVGEVEKALLNVNKYIQALNNSPKEELLSIVNALNGGYVAPTSGGDPVLNPNILPTGRNMFAVNAEETPSVMAWEKGKSLADNTIAMYRKAHNDSIPRKVSYTLWSSEFIETEGATIAQILYMLGVEPVRDPFGRVTDLKLIPSSELGRPRIDVVVQTSGQLRDLAASRLFLIGRAVKMAAEADDDVYDNYVAYGVVESERRLVEKGISPKEARELSAARVFGGINGNYGSGIQSMVEAGDRWEDENEIASVYMNNMGAMYGSEEDWEKMHDFVFEAALTNTDVVVQPRQSNTWGALSLDHVYEFMGGMNLAVRNVTGKNPDAYLSDYRNRNNAHMQEVKEAIGIESRTTILNPTYIKEKMNGGSGDASAIADVVRNTYGWNVMKPDAIDNELWDNIYNTYVVDENHLGVKEYFSKVNHAALQEMTAVMLETIRKGMWSATPEQISAIAELHTEMVNEHGASCSGFVCDNAKLRDFIQSKVSQNSARQYNAAISSVRAENISSDDDGMVMKREEMNRQDVGVNYIDGFLVGGIVIVALIIVILLIRHRRKTGELK